MFEPAFRNPVDVAPTAEEPTHKTGSFVLKVASSAIRGLNPTTTDDGQPFSYAFYERVADYSGVKSLSSIWLAANR
jgi:hypothetical protein